MFTAGVTEHLSSTGGLGDTAGLLHDQAGGTSWVRAVLEESLQASREHLLKANDEHAVSGSMGDHISAHEETSRAGRAVVVNVVDGDSSHSKLVEDALAASAVAVAVACNTLLNIVVVDMSIKHSLNTSLESKLGIVHLATGLDELGHAHAEDVDGLLLGHHLDECGRTKMGYKVEMLESTDRDG